MQVADTRPTTKNLKKTKHSLLSLDDLLHLCLQNTLERTRESSA
jgi:hypothetical protein